MQPSITAGFGAGIMRRPERASLFRQVGRNGTIQANQRGDGRQARGRGESRRRAVRAGPSSRASHTPGEAGEGRTGRSTRVRAAGRIDGATAARARDRRCHRESVAGSESEQQ
jgi:hypothetical protein